MLYKKQKSVLFGIILACFMTLAMPSFTAFAQSTLTVGSTPDAQYTSLQDALTHAQDGDIIHLVSDVQESTQITVDKHVTLITPSHVTLTITKGIRIQPTGTLTLGDGSKDHNLELQAHIDNYGTLHIKDGITSHKIITNYDKSTYQGEGGLIKATLKINERAAVSGKITGGEYLSETGDILDIYGTYDEISGGTFKTTGTDGRSSVYIQGTLNKISGGEFFSSKYSALSIQHGGVVNEISGGTFKSDAPKYWAVILFATGDSKAQVGKISGGTFEAAYAVFLKASGTQEVKIGEISGGTFTAQISALQVDKDTKVETISGGTFTGDTHGVFNVGSIDRISGGQFNGKKYYAVYNYSNGSLTEISNGTFIGGSSALCTKAGGSVQTITNGVFLGIKRYAYENLSDTATFIEPGLTGSRGNARFWGEEDAISGNVTYPDGFHMSAYETVLPVDGIDSTSFRYLKKSFTLSYDANGGTGVAPASETETDDDEPFTVADNPFTFTGKVFVGWNTAADGTGEAYQPGDEISLSTVEEGETESLGNTTLYAQWADVYTLLYNTDGAHEEAPVDSHNYQVGEEITVSQVVLSKEGYIFKGWQLAGKTLQPGESFVLTQDIIATAQNHTLTLTAIWEKIPVDTTENPDVPSNPTDTQTSPQPSQHKPSPKKRTHALPKAGDSDKALALCFLVTLSGGMLTAIAARKKQSKNN